MQIQGGGYGAVRAERGSSAANRPARAAACISSPHFAGAAATGALERKFLFTAVPCAATGRTWAGGLSCPSPSPFWRF
jgi:hypothetical protein